MKRGLATAAKLTHRCQQLQRDFATNISALGGQLVANSTLFPFSSVISSTYQIKLFETVEQAGRGQLEVCGPRQHPSANCRPMLFPTFYIVKGRGKNMKKNMSRQPMHFYTR